MPNAYPLPAVILEVCPFAGSVTSPNSDRFSFQLEVVTGKLPYPEYTNKDVVVVITKCKVLPRAVYFDGPGITPEVWGCWNEEANERAQVNMVLQMSNPSGNLVRAPQSFLKRKSFDPKLIDGKNR